MIKFFELIVDTYNTNKQGPKLFADINYHVNNAMQ